MKIVVSGATGLVGRRLVARLAERGDDVTALVRRPQEVAGARTVAWNSDGSIPTDALAGVNAIVNLAGENIGAKRWTAARKAALISSRVEPTRACVRALGGDGPHVLVNVSAVGYYGITSEEVTEISPPGADFLAKLCSEWERAAREGVGNGQRVVTPRLGVVLAREGGALPRLRQVTALGLGGPLGSGEQWLSWIHVHDAVTALVTCLDQELAGPVNVVAPHAVQQRELARALGHALHRPSFFPTPGFAVTLALGSGPASLALTGQKVAPTVLLARNFSYEFGSLDAALADLTSL